VFLVVQNCTEGSRDEGSYVIAAESLKLDDKGPVDGGVKVCEAGPCFRFLANQVVTIQSWLPPALCLVLALQPDM
jgi:hypothetical protein